VIYRFRSNKKQHMQDAPVGEAVPWMRTRNPAHPTVAVVSDVCSAQELASALLCERYVVVVDEEHIVRHVCAASLAWLPIDPQEIGLVRFSDLLHISHKEYFSLHPDQAVQQKQALVRHRDGTYHWYKITHHPSAAGVMLVLEPADERIARERDVHKAQIEAEHSKRERGEFLRHMSHELRTPLNAMMGFARMMDEGIFGAIEHPMYQEYMRLIIKSGDDLLDKIRDLMDLSAIGMEPMALHFERIVAHEWAESCLEDVQKVAIGRNIALHMHHAKPAVGLEVDGRLLRKALCYIVHNAIEYNHTGGVVEIHAGVDLAGGYIITVRDRGYGISQTQLDAIRHALADSIHLYGNVESYRPIGLGLTLAKEYIHAHGGDIVIESALGEGTCVTIKLPHERVIVLTPEQRALPVRQAKMRGTLHSANDA
jgi:signal transduction histidine kinase